MAVPRVVHPFPLANRLDPADFVRGLYNPALPPGVARYRIGDLVTTRDDAGVARAVNVAVPANNDKLAVAGQDWSMPRAYPYFFNRGVPLNRIDRRDEWVMTLAGLYNQALADDIVINPNLDVLFDAVAETLTVRNAAVSPTVKVLRVFEGVIGDENVRVVVNFLENKLL